MTILVDTSTVKESMSYSAGYVTRWFLAESDGSRIEEWAATSEFSAVDYCDCMNLRERLERRIQRGESFDTVLEYALEQRSRDTSARWWGHY